MRPFANSPGAVALALAVLSGCSGQAPTTEPAAAGECTACHGGADDSAPPRAASGATLTSDRAVGAHQAHLRPGPFRRAIACAECHAVPEAVDAVGHLDAGPAEVVFGGLSRARGATPSWDGARCAGTYCHGGTLAGGSNPSPLWTKVDGTQVACGTCHGLPPPAASGHPEALGGVAACARCHPGTVLPDGSIDVVGARHVDGVVQLGAAACAGCHGDPARTPAEIAAAPPRDTRGNTAVSSRGVGAHARHLSATSLRAPIPCAECHAVPENLLAHPDGTADLAWGPLARAGGAVPAWNAAAATCASTYCHGATLRGGAATAPVWTRVDGSQVRCGSCHGAPPQVCGQDRACGKCHLGYGETTVNAAIHVDGYLQLDGQTCTSCHGDPARAVALHAAPPGDLRGNVSTSARGVGAHMAHLTGTSLRAPIACGECHPPVTKTSHAQGKNLVVELRWGPLAAANGARPTWDRATARCAATYCHGATLAGGTETRPIWNRVDGTQADCGTCHGVPPPSPHPDRQDCSSCHPGYARDEVNLATHLDGVVDASAAGCTSCHGDAVRADASTQPAPPADTLGNRTPASRGVGAHQRHLAGGALRGAVACTECHEVPTRVGHADGKADLAFGPLARTDGAAPSLDAGTLRCAGTYCHGATLGGGSNRAPLWTAVDGAQAACGACHGVPPPAPHVQGTACGGCHPGYSATSVDPAAHVDGVVQATASCTSCHGDPARPEATAAAPPRDVAGDTATSAVGVGAHQRHLEGGALRPPLACAECHEVPATLALHPDGRTDVIFGSLARSAGAAPAWKPATASCASTYCHGATLLGGTSREPVWTRVDGTQAACTACHGLPPPSAAHASVAPGAPCGSCHPGYGVDSVDPSRHLDGVSDASGSCTACHGDPARPPATAAAPPRDTKDNVATAARGVGAHQAHLTGGSLRAGLACTECHPVPPDLAAHPGAGVELAWGPLARSGGAVPSWDGATLACSSYCHGATLAGGSDTTPVWNVVNGTQAACGTCHGVPPPAPHAQVAACGGCHGGYSATSVNPATHVDGTVQASAMTCTSCHGDPARVLVTGAEAQARSAPPVDTAGRSTATLRSVGAHLAHLDRGTGAIALPTACAECHVVPSSQAHADGAVVVSFGPRARTGGAAPAWDGARCSDTYCHGNHSGGTPSAPSWTSTARLACTACHPMPPATSAHSLDHEKDNGACSGCHRDTDATGTRITRPAMHVDGRVDGQCLDCHDRVPKG